MTFVLVDYKGGSAFKDCVQLPHTVGMVTDLDTAPGRAGAGVAVGRADPARAHPGRGRRQGHRGLHSGCCGPRGRAAGRPLPRLLIVIDEFASMVRELPDFVTGLVNIAQRGRSLGIHLLLATQRPSGVVSPEIRANTNLRIALRVTDPAESADVIDAPDAGADRQVHAGPGLRPARALLAGAVPGRPGRRPPARRRGGGAPSSRPGWPGWTGRTWPGPAAAARPAGTRRGRGDHRPDGAGRARSAQAQRAGCGMPAQHSPWLPALPATLLLADLPDRRRGRRGGRACAPVPYGLEDLPAAAGAAARGRSTWTPFGHLMAAGAPRSGRSQLLRTIAGALGRSHSQRRRAPVRPRLRQRRAAAARRAAALRRGRAAHPGRAGGPAARPAGAGAEPAAGAAGRRRVRRHHRAARAAAADGPDEPRLPHIVVLLDRWEGFTALARRARRRAPDRRP